MVEVTSRYEGHLRCTATHPQSNASITTDAPRDNHGRGEAFSPTDLVGAALGTCMMTIMGIVAARHSIDLTGMTARTEKEMTTDGPRRIKSLTTTIHVPLAADHPHRAALENAAHTCPVHKSLHADIEAPIAFVYRD